MRPRIAVIPVAGLGTRFLPATKAMPKEMLTVVDKPLIQYAVEEALAAGIERIVFVTGRGKTMLEDHFDYAPELEKALQSRGKDALWQQVRDLVPNPGCLQFTRQNEPLGLGHAIWCARYLVGDAPFAVILPDDLVWSGHQTAPVMQQMCEQYEQLDGSMVAVMTVEPEETSKYGIVDPVAGQPHSSRVVRAKGLVEKPLPENAPSRLAIIGRYILAPEIFTLLGQQQRGVGNEIQLTDAMASLMQEQSIYGFHFQGVRFDCGDKVGFQTANLTLAMEQKELRERLLPYVNRQLPLWKASQQGADQKSSPS